MVSKEGVGKVLKKVARIIPGIGSYQDKESVRESDKELRMRLSSQLDEALGKVEWLKTDLSKKGSLKHLGVLEDLTRHIEKVSRTIEYAPRGFAPLFASWKADEEALSRLFEYDKGICDTVSEIGEAIDEITGDAAFPESDNVSLAREKLHSIEKSMKDREFLLKEES